MRGIVTGRLAAIAVLAVWLLPASALADAPAEPSEPAPNQRGVFTNEEIRSGAAGVWDALTGERVRSGLAVVADVLIVRPSGIAATAVGFGLFLPAALLSMADYPDNVQESWDLFVLTPAQSVYDRPLGDL